MVHIIEKLTAAAWQAPELLWGDAGVVVDLTVGISEEAVSYERGTPVIERLTAAPWQAPEPPA